ncbi:lipopolysaccharide assembly protein LapA domain-containing protein [Chelatococcus sp. SYSU_G07232]|uniref:Lipopolysaccharide assembly protein LapA domain-containing protein n=1 Tax=Chelatococcus albus TaxID=3047466 RepID=A0ABT7AHP2_9HYPH|nr:lipopolysaccharide assembly protein LapA domain-containing protein [Chelatococcus sp. SYSU_G07232]MDJ1158884.1 lipopolysaccharide assembly protein LapA domain-containing protein [Chelatococcus sp. SYSU_G07232]
MKSLVKALVLVPLGLVIVLLAVANRAPVVLSLDPFSAEAPALSLTLPLFLLLFAAVMLGVLVGGVAAWLAQSKHRRAARAGRRDMERLRAEAERLRAAAGAAPPARPHP